MATLGNTNIGGTTFSHGAEEQMAVQVTVGETDFTLTALSVYTKTDMFTRPQRLVCYSDAAGVPDDILFQTVDYTVTTTAAWHTPQLRNAANNANISEFVLEADTPYWFSMHIKSGGGIAVLSYFDASGVSYDFNGDSFDAGAENPWSGGSAGTKLLSIYATGTYADPPDPPVDNSFAFARRERRGRSVQGIH